MIVRELFARLGMKTDGESFDKADAAISKVKIAAAAAASILEAGKVVSGLKAIVLETTAAADTIAKMSQRLGINTQALQELEFAAQIAGASQQDLASGLRVLTKFADEAASGMQTYVDEFDRLGVSVKDAEGNLKPVEQLFMEMSDGLAALETDTERAAIAQKLLGRGGVALVPLMNKGSKAIANLREEARETGGVMSDEFLRASEETTDEILRMEKAFFGVKIAITQKVRPAFDFLISKAIVIGKAIGRIVAETNILEAALAVLGAALVVVGVKFIIAFAAPLAIGLALAAVLAIIIIAVEDIITTFKGGDSAGKRFAGTLEEIYGWFSKLGEGEAILQAVLLPLQTFVDAAILAKDAISSLIILLTGGGTSGFKLLGEDASDRLEDFEKRTQTMTEGLKGFFDSARKLANEPLFSVGSQQQAVAPAAAGGTSVVSSPRQEVNITVVAAPGQSEEAIGKAVNNSVRREFNGMVDEAATSLPLVSN